MIYIVLGSALVLSMVIEIASDALGLRAAPRMARPDVLPSAVVLVALVAALRRWPRDWKVLASFTVALLIQMNQRMLPDVLWARRAVVLAIGAYVGAYGWRTRAVARGERNGLLLFALWFLIVVGLGGAFIALGWW